MSERWILTILLLTTCALLLPRLGAQCLNGEEATIALLAERILKYGLPYARDADAIITQEWGHESNRDGVWTLTPWLHMYFCAPFLRLSGANALSARLPFALAGVVSVMLVYLIARRFGYSAKWSFAIAFMLLINVQFLLFCRRVGVHALVILVATLISANEMGILFNLDYWVGLLQFSGLLVFWFNEGWQAVERKTYLGIRRILITVGTTTFLVMPFALYVCETGGVPIRVLRYGETPPAFRTMYPLAGVWEASQFLLGPLVLITILWLAFCQNAIRHSNVLRYSVCVLAGTTIAYYIMLRVFALPARYLFFAHTLPAFTLLLGEVLSAIAKHRAVVAGGVALLLLGTNVGEIWLPWLASINASNRHFVPPIVRSHILEYAKELWRMPSGPVDRLVSHLRVYSPSDTILFISYEAEPLMFHLNAETLRRLPFEKLPDAVILRTGWLCDYDRVLVGTAWGAHPEEPYRVSWQRMPGVGHMDIWCGYVKGVLKRYNYVRTTLPPADQWQQNSDETRIRYYCPDERLKEVTIWLRSTDSHG